MPYRARTISNTTHRPHFEDQVRVALDTPMTGLRVSAAAEAADVRRISVQVVDRVREAWKSQFLVYLFFATTAVGNPGGSQTVTPVTGSVRQAITANTEYLILSDANGLIELDVEVVGAGNRFVRGLVLGGGGDVQSSAAIAWA